MDTAVKFLKGSDTKFEGLAIPFGGPIAGKDLEGEDFGADTDFAFDWFPNGRPTIYDHALNPAVKSVVQGRQQEHELIDEGVFARGELDKSARYHATVARMLGAGKLYFSSGSLSHLVEIDDTGHIKRWPWVELSLTPEPANPYAVVHAVKSTDLVERLDELDLQIPADLVASALKALDATAPDSEDDGLPDGLKLADHVARVLGDVEAVRDRARSISGLRAKAGRVLSASTRERLLRHPASLRELADDLDDLLSNADAQKSTDLSSALLDYHRTLARLNGVELPAQGATQ